MAGRSNQSFQKRQKEQKRAAKAVEKRAAQQARRDRRAAGIDDDIVSLDDLLGTPDGGEPEATDAAPDPDKQDE